MYYVLCTMYYIPYYACEPKSASRWSGSDMAY